MSLSVDERKRNVELALKLFAETVGDEFTNSITFPGDDRPTRYDTILSTTWKVLAEKGFVEDKGFWFRLTGYGWLTWFIIEGKQQDPGFQQQYGKLSGYLKDAVKGRHEDVMVLVQDVADATNVPVGLISNIVHANVFQWVYNTHGARWVDGAEGYMIKIPVDFGLEMF